MTNDMRKDVDAVIERVRPAIQADGGRIVVVEVDETHGIVTLNISCAGACDSCSSSTAKLHIGVERIMMDHVGGVTSVNRKDDECHTPGTDVSF